jgi:hypothetical protein
MGAGIIVGLVLRLRTRLGPRSRTERLVPLNTRLHHRERPFYLGLARAYLVCREVESLQGLRQNALRLGAPGAGERFSEVVCRGLARGIASRRELQGIALAMHDGA